MSVKHWQRIIFLHILKKKNKASLNQLIFSATDPDLEKQEAADPILWCQMNLLS